MSHSRRECRVKTKGEKCQIASFGHSSRRPPPAKPQPMANGRAMISPLNERRDADHQADRRAGVGAGNQARQKRALQAQVGGAVIEEQPRDDAGGERDPEERHEDQAVGPAAPLEDEDVAEAPVADEHRGQGGHGRELHDERRQEHLLGREGRALH